MLTSCPACQQGLARYAETGLSTDYIVVELARHLLGQAWQETFVTKAKAGGSSAYCCSAGPAVRAFKTTAGRPLP